MAERLVQHEQGGAERAAYGTELLKRLSRDVGARLGRGFSERNLEQMRQFYLHWLNPPLVRVAWLTLKSGYPEEGIDQ